MNPVPKEQSFLRKAFGEGPPWILSLLAIFFAVLLSHQAWFQRINAVVSDEISRAIGPVSNGPIVLVHLDRDFSKAALQQLLARAIPALMDNYRAAALGVDIDFSGRGYSDLARAFDTWSQDQPNSARRVVWATRYERIRGQTGSSKQPEACMDCDSTCATRLRPREVFDGDYEPPTRGLAYAWNDSSGITRLSFRFVCHPDTTSPVRTFHFELVDRYCDRNPHQYKCYGLPPNSQSVAKLHTWYEAKDLGLCKLVQCDGPNLGAPPLNLANDLNNKLVILYSDIEGNDEHATLGGTRKGAEVVASLALNELLYGASNESLIELFKMGMEAGVTIILILLFGWERTEQWAVLVAGPLFAVLLFAIRRLSIWIPDIRDYTLALMLAFVIEVWLKAAWHNLTGKPPAETSSELLSPAGRDEKIPDLHI